MPATVRMTIDERRKYLTIMRLRYIRSTKQDRGGLLDEMESVTSLDRKTLIRLINGDLVRHPRHTQRQRTYTADVDDALRVISESWDYPCAARMAPNLSWMAQHLVMHGELAVSPDVLSHLAVVSISTVGRILQRVAQDEPKLPRRAPSGTSAAVRDIPMTRIPWDTKDPGHFETDLVHHSGDSTDGQYMHTLQLIDVATGWSERVALLGKSYTRMEAGFAQVLARLPFPIVALHPDNGGEFFSSYLRTFWEKEIAAAQISRSRPYHKNDNRFVEQRNSSAVRAYLGTQRLDTQVQTLAANRLYDKLWVYYNLFQPVLHMDEKTFLVNDDGSFKLKRHHDKAKTPFDRLCATGVLDRDKQEELERLREQTNPRRLRKEIYALIDQILAMPSAAACES